MSTKPFDRETLYDFGPVPTYSGRNLDQIAFPLGGIGTGMISLGGWGQLRDWEIMNRPALGFVIPNSFFFIKTEVNGQQPVTRVMEGRVQGAYTFDGHHPDTKSGQGLPRFANCEFTGRFPIADVALWDDALPVRVDIEAYNPFVPHDPDNSGIPAAVLTYRVTNTSTERVAVTVYGNLGNVIAGNAADTHIAEARSSGATSDDGLGGSLSGVYLSTSGVEPEDPKYGSMVLATTAGPARSTPRWNSKRLSRFWNAISTSDAYSPAWTGESLGKGEVACVAASRELAPGASAEFTYFICWHFPNYLYDMSERIAHGGQPGSVWKNYYATQWADSWEVARYLAEAHVALREKTVDFRDVLFRSTLPNYVIDAVSSQLSTVKSPTCLRLEDGTFYGFEGSDDTEGSCEGSCTHVWSYAQSVAYLFPSLQQSMRRAEYDNSMFDDGFVQFRLPLPLGSKAQRKFFPAADGQMGGVIQVYREWLLSGDREWLREMWPQAKKALEFAWIYWDNDKDGVPEGLQHVTWDTELYGPNTMVGSLYLCALRAAEEMARELGDEENSARYHTLFESGSAWTDEHLFNGEYYEQIVDSEVHKAWPENLRSIAERRGPEPELPWPRWQYGAGCIADHLLGQWYADMLGLGPLYAPSNIRSALLSIFKYNWKLSLADHAAFERIYALGDESGLLLGTWPRGHKPAYPFYFAPEVWPGVEYQVASNLIYQGMAAEGLSVAYGVRARFRGDRRNPWSEIECGRHYARSLSSYALLTALSGFHYSAPDGYLEFAPAIPLAETDGAFRSFFSVGSGWGEIEIALEERNLRVHLTVRGGSLCLRKLVVLGRTVIDGDEVTILQSGESYTASVTP